MEDKFYCSECYNYVDTEVNTIFETYDVEGVSVTTESSVRYCKDCGNQIFDCDLDSKNLINLYDEYKNKMDLLSSSEIKEIRNKLNLSQTEFSLLLDFPENSIERFENGSIQSELQDEQIRLASECTDKEEFINELENPNKYETSRTYNMDFFDFIIKFLSD